MTSSDGSNHRRPIEKAQPICPPLPTNGEFLSEALSKSAGYGIAGCTPADELTDRARTTLLSCSAGRLRAADRLRQRRKSPLARLLKLERELAVSCALGASKARLMRHC